MSDMRNSGLTDNAPFYNFNLVVACQNKLSLIKLNAGETTIG